MGRVRVFLAMSLDGFIAGEDDDLSWLPADEAPGPGALDFTHFMADIGAMLMGRRTYDVVAGFEGPWAYGDIPVLVPTHRALEPVQPTIRTVAGPIDALVDQALETAAGKDVYVDGGDLVRQALDADRVDEMVLTLVPIRLGSGVPLFTPGGARRDFVFGAPATYGRMLQLVATRQRG